MEACRQRDLIRFADQGHILCAADQPTVYEHMIAIPGCLREAKQLVRDGECWRASGLNSSPTKPMNQDGGFAISLTYQN